MVRSLADRTFQLRLGLRNAKLLLDLENHPRDEAQMTLALEDVRGMHTQLCGHPEERLERLVRIDRIAQGGHLGDLYAESGQT